MPGNFPKTTKRSVPLMTVKDVAHEDQTSEKTVRRAIAAGLLEVIRVGPCGRLIRIHPEAHAAYRRRRSL